MFCSICKKEFASKPKKSGGEKLPRGWSEIGGRSLCGECVRDRYVMRAIEIPVAGPIGDTWETLREALQTTWAQSTAVANKAAQVLLKADFTRTPEMAKMPPRPKVYLYGDTNALVDEHFSRSALVAILRRVEAKYGETRYKVLWLCDERPTLYKYPFQYSMHGSCCGLSRGKGGERIVSLPIAGRRWSLRLGGGPGFHRQAKQFDFFAANGELLKEISLLRKPCSASDDHARLADAAPGGGQTTRHSVVVKLVGWLPREERDPGENAMVVRTDPNALLVAEIPGRSPWIINADHAKRWQAEHKTFLQRLAEDRKYEKRWPAAKRQQINDACERRTLKHRRRIDTFIKQVSASLAGYAARSRVGTVIYDDAARGYIDSFPWFELKSRLAVSLDGKSIKFVSSEVADVQPCERKENGKRKKRKSIA